MDVPTHKYVDVLSLCTSVMVTTFLDMGKLYMRRDWDPFHLSRLRYIQCSTISIETGRVAKYRC